MCPLVAVAVLSLAASSSCFCGVCDHGNESQLLDAMNRTQVHLAAQRGVTTNRKRRQKPVYNVVCNKVPLPGYPHTMRPPPSMATPRVQTTNPHGLAYGALIAKARAARDAVAASCLPTGGNTSSVALFLGDSLTFGTLVQSRFNWPNTVDPATGTDTNSSSFNLAIYWRVALYILEKRIPAKQWTPTSGEFWWRRAYAVGRGGITAKEFNEDYLKTVTEHLSGSKAGNVTFVSYFLGTNDAIVQAGNSVNGSAEFESSLHETLTAIRRQFDGPIVLGTIPFCSDPGRSSREWLSRPVWYNWALNPINLAVRRLAEEFEAGVADYHQALYSWRRHLPQIDGTHPAWWAHKVLALQLLKGMDHALEVMPRKTYCT
ncbi:hypothetical protein DIPPA_33609 [Diplonema papillatum]|nr:hypothetical protein DIPPA_33609 [Diplonema papillatum]